MDADQSPEWAALVPELTVTDLATSLRFYRAVGFSVRFERDRPPFAYLDLGPAQLMLSQDHDSPWNTAPLERPFGRGINLEIAVPDCSAIEDTFRREGRTVFRPAQDAWYRVAPTVEEGQRELLVHDPDGYLLRFAQSLGRRVRAE